MSQGFTKIQNGVTLVPQNTTSPNTDGDLRYNSSTNKVEMYNGTVDPVVGETTSATLQNKNLDASNVAVTDHTDATKKIEFQTSGSTTAVTTTLSAASTANRTLTLPDVTDTLVGVTATQTLTNKTLNSTSTATGINVASITPDGGTHTLTFPVATDTLVGRTTTDTLTHKTFDSTSNATGIQLTSFTPDGTHTLTAPSGVNDTLVTLAATQTLSHKTFDSTSVLTGAQIASFTPDGTHTVTVPTVTDTIATQTAAQTLTHKTFDSTSVMTGVQMASFTPDGTHTLTAPTSTDTLVGRITNDTGANRLKNKDLDANSLKIVDSTDQTKVIEFNTTAMNPSTIVTIAAAVAGAAATITLPGSSDTLVGRATTDTLTHKTFDSTSTITGINMASFTPDNGTHTLTAPTATDTLVGRATTDTLTNKTFGDSPTFTQISTPSSPASGFNKIYPKSDGNFYTLNSSGIETPVGSGSGGTKNYLGTVNNVNGNGNFELGTLGGWFSLGFNNGLTNNIPIFTLPSGISLASNLYIFTVTSATAALNTTYTNLSQTFTVVQAISGGTTLVCVGTGNPQVGAHVLTKTGGGAGDTTISYSTWITTVASATIASVVNTGVLAGAFSMQALWPSNSPGSSISSPTFTIDPEDQAKVLSGKFYYAVNSGGSNANFSGTNSNSFEVLIYDITNGQFVQPAGTYNLVQSSGTGYCTFNFQTASNASKYQLLLVCPATLSGPVTMTFDDFSVSPQTAPSGPAMSDPVAVTVTSSWTPVTYAATESRDGKWANYDVFMVLTGAPTGNLTVNLPAGRSIDTTLASYSAGLTTVGDGSLNKSGSQTYPATVLYNNSTSVIVQSHASQSGTNPVAINDGNSVSATNPVTWASGDHITLRFRVPIAGWSSNTAMSSDTDTRVIASEVSGTSTSITSATVTITPTTIVKDTSGSWNGSTFTCVVTGFHQINATLGGGNVAQVAGNAVNLYYKVNSNSAIILGVARCQASLTTTLWPSGAAVIYLNAGDTVVFQAGADVTQTPTFFAGSIFRVSGPAVVQATESVNCSYVNTSGQSIPNNSQTNITNWTKVFDTHSFFNASTGIATLPVSGKYRATLQIAFPSGFTVDTGATNAVIIQGGSSSLASVNVTPFAHINTQQLTCLTTNTFNCQAGDTLTFQVIQANGTTRALYSADTNYIKLSIERVGN